MEFMRVFKYDFKKISLQALIVLGAMVAVNVISFLLLSIFNLGGASVYIMWTAAIATEACVSYVILLSIFVIAKNFLKRRDIFVFTNISYNKLVFLRFCEGIIVTAIATVAAILAYSLVDFTLFEKYYQFRLWSGLNSAFTGVGKSLLYWLFPLANVIFTCLALSLARLFASIMRVVDIGAVGTTLALFIVAGVIIMHIAVLGYKMEALAVFGRSDLPLNYLMYDNEYNVINQSFFTLTTTLVVPAAFIFNLIGIVLSNVIAHAISGRKLRPRVWDSYAELTLRKALIILPSVCYIVLSVFGVYHYNRVVPSINSDKYINIFVRENEIFEIDYDFKNISLDFSKNSGKKEDVLIDGKNMLIKKSGVYDVVPRSDNKRYSNLRIYVLDSTFEDYRPVRSVEDIIAYSEDEKMYLANDIIIDASRIAIELGNSLFGNFGGTFANPYGHKITLVNTNGYVISLYNVLKNTAILDSLIVEGFDFEDRSSEVYSVAQVTFGTVLNCTFEGKLIGQRVNMSGLEAERIEGCIFIGDIRSNELENVEEFFWIGEWHTLGGGNETKS